MALPLWLTKIALMGSGWYPGRDVWEKVSRPPQFEVFPVAKRILSEFGNLKIGPSTDITVLVPMAATEVANEIRSYEVMVGKKLYPLGYREHQDREYLIVDDIGRIYLLTDGLKAMASSFERALPYIVWQRIRRKDLKADLEPIGLYGKVWHLENGSG
jgi:hypothetical protein